jgi:hypothetical protein
MILVTIDIVLNIRNMIPASLEQEDSIFCDIDNLFVKINMSWNIYHIKISILFPESLSRLN